VVVAASITEKYPEVDFNAFGFTFSVSGTENKFPMSQEDITNAFDIEINTYDESFNAVGDFVISPPMPTQIKNCEASDFIVDDGKATVLGSVPSTITGICPVNNNFDLVGHPDDELFRYVDITVKPCTS
jgi:hypothetical protein